MESARSLNSLGYALGLLAEKAKLLMVSSAMFTLSWDLGEKEEEPPLQLLYLTSLFSSPGFLLPPSCLLPSSCDLRILLSLTTVLPGFFLNFRP